MSISTSHWLRAETTSRVQLLPLLEYAPSLPLRTLAVAFPLFLSDTSAELFIHDIDLVDDVLARTMENSPRLLLYVHMPIFDERDRPSVRRLLATSDEITGPFGAAFPRTCNAGRGRIRYSLPPKEYGFPEICDPQTHLYPIPACHAHG
ncbi:hypothetical protein CERSUDRAFT_116995 [Gelatoporia subvermispora B]|uniref:Uncharacterized protein n=1 Tax=Ceriporiopsis subvermispora (strain B) TaxID=914234 RepID=M2R7Z3_CERS8|nr:hypothetical protein CERSUDRAFT_116995 [Gelatoporia subvermispora B]